MSEIKINLPKLGESIVSATVVRWFKKVGDQIALDEPLLEVSTDKVNSEIPSPVAGILKEILVENDQEVQVGEPMAVLTTSAHLIEPKTDLPLSTQRVCGTGSEDILSPSVIRLLKEKGISLQEIDRIPRTGQGGRLTKKDVEDYSTAVKKEEVGTERVKMSGLRKAIADNMVKSFYEAPHASLVTEVDVTNIVETIQTQKELFQEKHGAKLSVTAFVARSIAEAVKEYPLLNSSLDGDTIVMKHFVNLGVAVSVDQGVMVPVIRNIENLTLPDIAKQISELALKSREHRLDPQEVKDGTMTLTNFGMTGVMMGIPIIRYPEVAIVGLGAITKKVMVMPDNTTAIRSAMWISLTFDHRVLDGIYGCGFLNALKKKIEESTL